ncbi:MAG: efflux RND transporter periplasmic adaptor subunit [Pseudomonadota bacterium]|nr:efflux RND transporter periplasmic adaptor subunit [Pseudomonadota bacterium]
MNKAVVATLVVFGSAAAGVGGYWAGTRQGPAALPAAPAQAKGGGQSGGGAGNAAGQPVTVEAAKVSMAALPQTLTAVGSLRSDESVVIRPEVAGRVSAILFKEGQRVAKGAPLVRLDTSINDADVKQARANHTLARSKYERAINLQKQNFISAQARDEAENNFRVAEASVALAEAKFEKTQIRAPFTGVIGLRSVSVGDYVKEGAEIVNLEAIDPLKLDFRIPEIYYAQLRVGQPVEITLDAQPGRTFPGQVYAVNPLVDTAGRSVVVRATVRNPDTALRPGMFARVRLITRDEREALMVPEQALVPQGQDQYVFRVVNGRAQRVKVEVGQRRNGRAEVVKGLEPQDIVVTAGQLKIRDGAELKVARVDAGVARTAATGSGVATDRPAARQGGTRGEAAPVPPSHERKPEAPAKADATPSSGARS